MLIESYNLAPKELFQGSCGYVLQTCKTMRDYSGFHVLIGK